MAPPAHKPSPARTAPRRSMTMQAPSFRRREDHPARPSTSRPSLGDCPQPRSWDLKEPTMPDILLIDDPAPFVRRLTLNRPEKRNALSNPLRAQVFEALEAADSDPAVRVTILRGAGSCFSAGYDLGGGAGPPYPFHTAAGAGHWSRHVVEGCLRVWDMAKPVAAPVHGWRPAGGPERVPA